MNQDSNSSTKQALIYVMWPLISAWFSSFFQSFIALSEVTKQVTKKNPDFKPGPVDYTKVLVISLGTGSNKTQQKYNAKLSASWGPISWIYYNGSTPIIDAFSESSVDTVNYYNCIFFNAAGCESNYFRIDVSFFTFKNILNLIFNLHVLNSIFWMLHLG